MKSQKIRIGFFLLAFGMVSITNQTLRLEGNMTRSAIYASQNKFMSEDLEKKIDKLNTEFLWLQACFIVMAGVGGALVSQRDD